MAGTSYFHHALKFRKDICIGCSHCMTVCPCEAIRIKNGKASLLDNRCVDCGQCYKACPVGAIIVEQDDFSRIFEFKNRVALVPTVLIGQFPEEVTQLQMYSVLMELGFTHIFEVEHGVEIVRPATEEYLDKHSSTKPLISAYCPAIVRLIQVKFPTLTNNLILVKPPLDISATYIRKKLMDQGDPDELTGVFYITPCAAKIAAIKSPVGEETSPITGVINMDFIFNKVYTAVKQGFGGQKTCQVPYIQPISAEATLFPLTGGETSLYEGRCLAIDEITNVMEFLEKLENEEFTDIDFLELRSCDQSCAGGILTSGNRFFTVERLVKKANQETQNGTKGTKDIESEKEYLLGQMKLSQVNPRNMEILDHDMGIAMQKMKKVHELMKILPIVDCGLCGAPSCKALAEDIVQDKATLNQCIFIQKIMEKEGIQEPLESMDVLKKIWGDDKFEKEIKIQNQ